MFRLPRLTPLILLGLLCAAHAAPLKVELPLQAEVPALWTQTRLPGPAQSASVTAPGSPPPVALVLFAAPLGRQASASDLRAFIAGVEGVAATGGRLTLTLLSEKPRTVGGVKGVERRYTMLVRASGVKVGTRIWFGAGPKFLYQMQMTNALNASAAQTGSFDQMLDTMTFKAK
ncbi:hypothetical protein [Deinococcus sp.]|uniref:hypothetical protein n=1 Tax=Deinococcus sp. TaxID=47478 RepID=UPI0025F4EA33|nr:hypothetical protein [Deinococcus sp.]